MWLWGLDGSKYADAEITVETAAKYAFLFLLNDKMEESAQMEVYLFNNITLTTIK